MATNQVAHLGIKVSTKGAQQAKNAVKSVGDTAKRVKDQIFSLNGALGALGAGAVIKSVIKSASGLESLKVRLKFLTGSAEDAGKAFDTMTGFASKVPFALEDIQKASPLLLTVTDDIDELNGLLEMTGDIAAVSGLDFVKTAEQLQRAMASGIASADLFRERGVASFLGFEAGVTVSAEQTRQRLQEMWANSTTTAVGATKELAKTFQGQVSMMEDAWFKLKIQFADTGIFEMAKDVVLSITESLGKQETIDSIKSFGRGIVSIGEGLGSIWKLWTGLPPYMQETGIVLAILGGKKVKWALATITALGLGFEDLQAKVKAHKNPDIQANITPNIHADEITWATGTSDKIKEEQKLQEKLRKEFVASSKVVEDWNNKLWKSATGLSAQEKLTRDYREQIKALNETFINTSISIEKQAFLLDNLHDFYEEAIADIKKGKLEQRVKEIAEGMEDSITDAIANMTQGLGSFRDVVNNIFNQIMAQMIRMQVVRPLLQMAGLGGGDTSILSSIVGKMGMAGGGNVNANQSYVVGEAGKEVFIPSRSGQIVPNHQLNTSTGEVRNINAEINFNVQAIDANSFNSYLVNNRDTIEGIINSSLTTNGSVRRTIRQVV